MSGGKVNLPALGFGMGDVVLLELLKARGLLPDFHAALDAFCLVEDESLRGESLRLVQDLRQAGLAVEYPMTPAKPDKQFKRAIEIKAACTVKLERGATGELQAKIKDLKTRAEQTVPPGQAARLIRRVGAPATAWHFQAPPLVAPRWRQGCDLQDGR